MNNRFRAVGYGLERALRGLLRRPGSSALATGAIAVTLLLLALVHLVATNIDAMVGRWGGGAQMIVYLRDGSERNHAERIMAALDHVPAVAHVGYVSPSEARQRLRASLGRHGEFVSGIDDGLLPASIEVQLRDGIRDVATVHPIVDRLRSAPDVESVEFVDDANDRLGAVIGVLRAAAVAFALIVAAICLYVVATTAELARQARQNEVELCELLGASSMFVRGPLLLEGALQGAVGAGAAVLGLWLAFSFGLAPKVATLTGAFAGLSPRFLGGLEVATLVGIGAAMGLGATWYATRRRQLAA
jgi:cell division transport system permease protein